jgi:hypothetical protein
MVLACNTGAVLVFALSVSEPVVHQRIAEPDRLFRLGHNHRDGLLCTRFLLVFSVIGGRGGVRVVEFGVRKKCRVLSVQSMSLQLLAVMQFGIG